MTFEQIQQDLTRIVEELERCGDKAAAGYVKLAKLKIEMAQLLTESGDDAAVDEGSPED